MGAQRARRPQRCRPRPVHPRPLPPLQRILVHAASQLYARGPCFKACPACTAFLWAALLSLLTLRSFTLATPLPAHHLVNAILATRLHKRRAQRSPAGGAQPGGWRGLKNGGTAQRGRCQASLAASQPVSPARRCLGTGRCLGAGRRLGAAQPAQAVSQPASRPRALQPAGHAGQSSTPCCWPLPWSLQPALSPPRPAAAAPPPPCAPPG